jgi:succinate dehydrogenase / fumarate reductase, cytochrome b subunit
MVSATVVFKRRDVSIGSRDCQRTPGGVDSADASPEGIVPCGHESDALVNLTDRSYLRLRRIHALSGIVPVALYLVAHFLTNSVAIRGSTAFNRMAQTLDQLPGVRLFEIFVIGVPILFHIVLGILLGNAAVPMDRADVYPRPWMGTLQRATGGFLAIYVVFHVWATRLSPDVLKGERDLFGVMSKYLEHPGGLVLHVLGVFAASAHLGLGVLGFSSYWRPVAEPTSSRPRVGLAWTVFVVMSVIGLNALLAFVAPWARWLEMR